METLQLLAVDGPESFCREDGFRIDFNENGSLRSLTVASVVPPEDLQVFPSAFLRNIFLPETPDSFLRKCIRREHGLQPDEPRDILAVIFTFERDEFKTEISSTRAVIEISTFEEFSSRSDFRLIKNSVEQFFFQNEHVHWKYTTGITQTQWKEERTDAKRIISAMLGMFGYAVCQHAYNIGLRTFKLSKGVLKFKVNRQAYFRGPLRRALSFINMLNMVATIQEKPQPYTVERVQSLIGEGYPIEFR
jgi:hypothetical protein